MIKNKIQLKNLPNITAQIKAHEKDTKTNGKITPYSYQQEALDSFLQLPKPKLPLFWEMRLGKSPTCIWAIQEYFPDWGKRKHLFVCPSSVIVSWKEEFKKHNITPFVFQSNPLNKELQDPIYQIGNFFITNFECLTRQADTLKNRHWDSVVIDESSRLRNPKTATAEQFCDPQNFPYLLKDDKEQFRAVLSGTPNPESDLDYFNQFKFLYGSLGKYKDYWHFKNNCFTTSDEKGNNKPIPRPSFIPALAKFLDKYAFCLTRRKAGVFIPNVYEKRFVKLEKKARDIYNEFELNWFTDFCKEFLDHESDINKFKSLESSFAVAAQAYLHQLACGYPKKTPEYSADHKWLELKDLIQTDLKREKVVVWCRYRREINELQQRLAECKVESVALTGGIPLPELENRIARFRKPLGERRQAQVCICQLQKAAYGMDLSIADTQVFFSRNWSANLNDQATDRLIRTTKKSGILTIDIITEDTIDEDLYWTLIEKRANSSVYKMFLQRTNLSNRSQSYFTSMSHGT